MKKILVVGDIMLDKYIYVTTERNAPESGNPIWDEERVEYRLGGAANVAVNIARLFPESKVNISGISSDNPIIKSLFLRHGIRDLTMPDYSGGMIKTRYVKLPEYKQLFRADNFKKFEDFQSRVFKHKFTSNDVESAEWDAVVFSDYDKGTITEEVVRACKDIPLRVVDSKRKDLRMYMGSTLLKLNEQEYSAQAAQNVESLFECVVVTKGEKGAELRVHSHDFHRKPRASKWFPSWNRALVDVYTTHVVQFPVEKANVVDITGAGDTHCAAMTVALLQGKDISDAIKFANGAARDVVEKFGTSAAGD